MRARRTPLTDVIEFPSGMRRDSAEGKTDYTLIFDGPMFERWATHLTQGGEKHGARNWQKANGKAEWQRFRQSAFRHFVQWLRGDQDEDHAAALFFNINGAEYVSEREFLTSEPFTEPCGDTEWCNDCGGEFPESCDCVDLPGESLVSEPESVFITFKDGEVVLDERQWLKPCFETCNGVCRDCEGVG